MRVGSSQHRRGAVPRKLERSSHEALTHPRPRVIGHHLSSHWLRGCSDGTVGHLVFQPPEWLGDYLFTMRPALTWVGHTVTQHVHCGYVKLVIAEGNFCVNLVFAIYTRLNTRQLFYGGGWIKSVIRKSWIFPTVNLKSTPAWWCFFSIQKLDSRKNRQFNAPLHQFVQIGPDMSVGTR